MIVWQFIIVFFHMCMVPYLTGSLFFYSSRKKEKTGIAVKTAAGLMICYAVYEVLAMAMQVLGKGFRLVSHMYLAISVVLAIAGAVFVVLELREIRFGDGGWKKYLPAKADVYFLLALLMIAVQIGAILIMATPDKDDAFYSGLSSMSLTYDYLLERDAYNGKMLLDISKRYVISELPVYQASLSLYSGLHHLVITHNLFPLFYMPLAYGVYYQLGKRFLEKEGYIGAAGKFLFFFALMHLVGNYYVFSPENFLVTRIWQGKALFAAIGIPMLWICGQRAVFDPRHGGKWDEINRWLLLVCVLVACIFMGETGLFLGPFMLACQTLAACMVNKNWKRMIGAVLCCVPNVIVIALLFL